MKLPILVWRFEDAPVELQFPFNAGDEDWVAAVPPNYSNQWIAWIESSQFGCCDVDEYTIDPDSGIVYRVDKDSDDNGKLEPTELTAPDYKGYRIFIGSHA